MKTKQGFITELDENEIFVFGSNLAGIHAGGAAKFAKDNFGAIEGCGIGPQGKCWAIPTLDHDFIKLPLDDVKFWIECFKIYAEIYNDKIYYFTPIGTGIAGFTVKEIKSILPKFPKNVIVDKLFK